MKFGDYPKIGSFENVAAFRAHLAALELALPCDDSIAAGADAPLAAPCEVLGRTMRNRFAVQPMEGWDALEDGRPSERTRRRWQRFGLSGAKLVWGGEAVAVRPDGRANPNQLYFADHTQKEIAGLRELLVAAHKEAAGSDRDLVIGLQLTHSGRFCRPTDKKRLEPRILYNHPILDRKFGVSGSSAIMSDDEIARLVEDFVAAAKRARDCGFDFVDIKHCHGYLGHEFLSAVDRPGRYGGSIENRARFLREVASGIRAAAPGLEIAVRLSAFDLAPFHPDPAQSSGETLGPGVLEVEPKSLPYRHAFGVDASRPDRYDLAEPKAFLRLLEELGIRLVNITAGSPYYNPHIQRPALYPPSDGYLPPEDPLVGVKRQIEATRELKRAFPRLTLVGTGYTYLQEFLPNVAQAVVREGWVDFVGLGRMMLAYPELPRDVLAGKGIQKKRLCRSFSDCTTAPRNGLNSGCYPLDPEYKKSPDFKVLAAVKKAAKLT
jgi:2,4-dienoyl-CoA reductase-like NADH-dependent reductase (Old Yellow Enzyme family)